MSLEYTEVDYPYTFKSKTFNDFMANGFKNGNGLIYEPAPPSPPASELESLEELPMEPETSQSKSTHILETFLEARARIDELAHGHASVRIDGTHLSIPQVTAVARFNAPVELDSSGFIRKKVEASRRVVDEKLENGTSIYGISTGFGGSADTRTKDFDSLGFALLQMQHIGILPSVPMGTGEENQDDSASATLPLLDPFNSLSMPPSWVRAAILIRINSLVRGHSAVRWTLIDKMTSLLTNSIIPVVPLRGSISASGDLSPLSYVAGTLIGEPNIFAYTSSSPSSICPASEALKKAGIQPLTLLPKEHLGILNGTAFSAGVAALATDDAVHMALLANVCTALGHEALLGTRASHVPFIHEIARPHPGQVESARLILNLLTGSRLAASEHEKELTVDEDVGKLRQDRYPLRTSPQFLGPQMEDILSAWNTITIECNSTTDNPLVDGDTGEIHHAGNFQAMAVSNAMEKTRLSLHHIGKILFAQCTELLNPAFNWGLPPSLAMSNPSLNYHAKGLDIAVASYVGELGYLANPVTTHIQSAEMHNQAINSLALISARATLQALDVLAMLVSSYLYILCQAVDIRAMQSEFDKGVDAIIGVDVASLFGPHVSSKDLKSLTSEIRASFHESLEATSTMDAELRMKTASEKSSTALLVFLASRPNLSATVPLSDVKSFQKSIARKTASYLESLRFGYLSGAKGQIPASSWLGKTKAVYEFIRVDLGIKMHGLENMERFERGLGVEGTIGQSVSKIYEAIRDGKMQDIVAGLF